MKFTATKWRTVELLGFGTVLGLVILAVAFLVLTAEIDRTARAREQSLVANGIAGRLAEERQLIVPQVLWDDAVAHVANNFDLDWTRSNIGEFLSQTASQSLVFVLDNAGRVRFAMSDGHDVPPAIYDGYRDFIAPLIDAVRTREQQRGSLARVGRSARLISHPIQESTLETVDGQTYILSASLIQPDFGLVTQRDETAPVVVSGKRIDGAFLTAFARRFLLRDLQLSVGAPTAADEASIPLTNFGGAQVAALSWEPIRPGTDLRRKAGAPLIAVLVALIALCVIFHRRSRAITRDLEASQAQVSHAAQHDSLTGLPNRVHFSQRLDEAFAAMRRSGDAIAVHHIDLDRFKEVNDRLGHHCGDELIIAAAKRIADRCRASDTFARLGGDEFAIIQSPATAATAGALAERLVSSLALTFELSGGHAAIGASVGVALLTIPPADAAEALRQSDYALYHAKERGRGQYAFFSPEMDAAAREQQLLATQLRDAILRNELSLAYQPRIHASGRVVGVEGHAYWEHPDRGIVRTRELVAMAEDCGLADDLGLFTLRRAIEDSARWPEIDVSVPLATNHLRSRSLVTTLWQFTAQREFDPFRCELELTESALTEDDPDVTRSLRELAEMGFAFALDDFGTAGLRLDQLRKVPLHRVKLGRAFTRDLGDDPAADVLAAAILKLGTTLRIQITADGIEHAEQREKVLRIGYTELQGPLIAAAMTPDELVAYLSLQSQEGEGEVAA